VPLEVEYMTFTSHLIGRLSVTAKSSIAPSASRTSALLTDSTGGLKSQAP